MSRPTWHCEIRLTLVNGTSGAVHLDARDLITLREVRAQFDKATRMAETLAATPAEDVDEMRSSFKVVS